MTTIATTSVATSTSSATRALLTCGAVASPLWAVVSLAQAAVRPGFDLTQQPLSTLSIGPSGWVQILNFVVAGVLTILGSVGLRRAIGGWAPRLLAVNGAGMVAAGFFVMDPLGAPLTWHSYGHMAAGTISFGTLIAACYVLGRRYRKAGDRRRAVASRVAGTALLVGDFYAMSGSPAGSLVLAVGAIAAMLWVSVVAAQHR